MQTITAQQHSTLVRLYTNLAKLYDSTELTITKLPPSYPPIYTKDHTANPIIDLAVELEKVKESINQELLLIESHLVNSEVEVAA